MNTGKSTVFQGNHILVVDDEEQVAKFLTEMLTIKGCKVTTFNSSVKAQSYFQNNKDSIELVLTDQTMPELTGTELAISILQEKPDTPIFLITGYSEAVDNKQASDIGIKEYISKPFKLAELVEKMQQYLSIKT